MSITLFFQIAKVKNSATLTWSLFLLKDINLSAMQLWSAIIIEVAIQSFLHLSKIKNLILFWINASTVFIQVILNWFLRVDLFSLSLIFLIFLSVAFKLNLYFLLILSTTFWSRLHSLLFLRIWSVACFLSTHDHHNTFWNCFKECTI